MDPKKEKEEKMNRYLTIKNNVETEIVVKKSKFIASFINILMQDIIAFLIEF